ncbi:MAG: type II secretion system protein, partial [Tissierellia bacterium]|nr:type II secretion system protein [Tissierellia bacterium]
MNKKGFTLIELLAIIVILAVIALIATPMITDAINEAREREYKIQENYISKAAMNFVAVNREYIPDTKGHINIIKLSELQASNMLDEIFDSKNSSQKCDGYAYVKKEETVDLKITSFLKCGSNYITEGYVEEPISKVDVLIVAGGGAGGSHVTQVGTQTGSGGGGAGGLIYRSDFIVDSLSNIEVIVGAGGISPETVGAGENGSNSKFATFIAIGGGGGGHRNSVPKSGGSGGGVNYNSATGGSGTVGQGYAGGNGGSFYGGSGGGGAAGPGVNATGNNGTAGGNGLYYGNIFGDSYGLSGYFAGGGGGGTGSGTFNGTEGLGGLGGGGNGGNKSNGTSGLI